MKEKNQQKKTTTIAIDIATSESLDTYCRKHGILKKDFVKIALEWFDNMDIDITSETHYMPNQEVKNDPVAPHLPGINQLNGLYQLFSDYIVKSTPNLEEIAKTAEEMGTLRAENKSLQTSVHQLNDKIAELSEKRERILRELIRVQNEQKTIGKIKINIPL